MAEGGIINRPTLLLAGERGREAIVPLDRSPAIVRTPITNHFHQQFTFNFTGTSDEILEKLENEDYWTSGMKRAVIKVIQEQNALVLGSVFDKN